MPTNTSVNSVFSIPEFCLAHRISKAMFYVLQRQGKAPKVMFIGRRRLISFESAAKWRRKMEMNGEVDNTLSETPANDIPTVIAPHVSGDSTRSSNKTNRKPLEESTHD